MSQGNPEGLHAVDSDRGGGVNTVNGAFPNVPDPVFSMNFTVTHVPSPPHAQIDGRTSLGGVCLGGTAATELLVRNAGELPLDITGFSISGAGYSILPNTDAPYTLPGGEYAKLTVVFSPTELGQGAGTLTVASGDPCVPSLQVPLTASVIHATISAAPARTVFPPTIAACGSSQTTVSVTNSGDCELVIDGASMDNNSYSVNAGTLPLRIAPGATATLTVTFAPRAVGHAVPGTLTIRSNNPLNPTTAISFCGEGLPTGIRVIVLRANGTPYPLVDQITVTGGPSKTNINANSVPLANPGPPSSCETLQYHLQSGLLPTSPSGSGSTYELKVKVGSKTQRMTFALRNCEFKPITVQIP